MSRGQEGREKWVLLLCFRQAFKPVALGLRRLAHAGLQLLLAPGDLLLLHCHLLGALHHLHLHPLLLDLLLGLGHLESKRHSRQGWGADALTPDLTFPALPPPTHRARQKSQQYGVEEAHEVASWSAQPTGYWDPFQGQN